jgi:hypothetical protein
VRASHPALWIDLSEWQQQLPLLAVAVGDNVVRMLPPLIIDEPEIVEANNRIDGAAERIESKGLEFSIKPLISLDVTPRLAATQCGAGRRFRPAVIK